jgi:hypothetical protein
MIDSRAARALSRGYRAGARGTNAALSEIVDGNTQEEPVMFFDSLDPSMLATVHGGQDVVETPSTDGRNTDTTTRRIGVYLYRGRIPIPYRYDRTNRTRTDFGHCVDESARRCETAGGENPAIAACKLDGIENCWNQR